MKDIFDYIWGAFKKPFRSRLFWITFIMFIPTSTFGIYYKMLSKADAKWNEAFNPENFMTYLIPLFSSVVLEGIMIAFSRATELDKSSAEFEIFRDSMVVAFFCSLLLALIIYMSLGFDCVLLSLIATIILWVMWITVHSGKRDYGPTKKWSPTGSTSTHSVEDVTDARR